MGTIMSGRLSAVAIARSISCRAILVANVAASDRLLIRNPGANSRTSEKIAINSKTRTLRISMSEIPECRRNEVCILVSHLKRMNHSAQNDAAMDLALQFVNAFV